MQRSSCQSGACPRRWRCTSSASSTAACRRVPCGAQHFCLQQVHVCAPQLHGCLLQHTIVATAARHILPSLNNPRSPSQQALPSSSSCLATSDSIGLQALGRKLETPLLYPVLLDMRPFTAGAVTRRRHQLPLPPNVSALLYELYAIVVHKGNLQASPLLVTVALMEAKLQTSCTSVLVLPAVV